MDVCKCVHVCIHACEGVCICILCVCMCVCIYFFLFTAKHSFFRSEKKRYHTRYIFLRDVISLLKPVVSCFLFLQTVQYADLYFSNSRQAPAPALDRVLYSETVGDTSVSGVQCVEPVLFAHLLIFMYIIFPHIDTS